MSTSLFFSNFRKKMSFCRMNTLIEEGHTAIIYLSFSQLYPVKVKRGLVHHTKYGSLKHADLIGKPYGTKFACSQGTVFVLQGDPNMWTISLPHRTQIIYTPNISVITLQLELKPGSVVVESGTGSASLSHALIRTVYSHGHLHTFEFHEGRAQMARDEFAAHQLAEHVTVYHRDVCNDGFALSGVADAVFLDLPSPWKALASAKQAMRTEGGRICSFSPCIEQVQKTALELTRLGFTDIYTVESLRRVLCVKKYDMLDFDFNMDNHRVPRPPTTDNNKPVEQQDVANDDQDDDDDTVCSKRKEAHDNGGAKGDLKKQKKTTNSDNEDDDDNEETNAAQQVSHYAAKAINLQPGHTGFLTFATLLHKDYQN